MRQAGTVGGGSGLGGRTTWVGSGHRGTSVCDEVATRISRRLVAAQAAGRGHRRRRQQRRGAAAAAAGGAGGRCSSSAAAAAVGGELSRPSANGAVASRCARGLTAVAGAGGGHGRPFACASSRRAVKDLPALAPSGQTLGHPQRSCGVQENMPYRHTRGLRPSGDIDDKFDWPSLRGAVEVGRRAARLGTTRSLSSAGDTNSSTVPLAAQRPLASAEGLATGSSLWNLSRPPRLSSRPMVGADGDETYAQEAWEAVADMRDSSSSASSMTSVSDDATKLSKRTSSTSSAASVEGDPG